MSTVIKVENLSKQYRLGDVGTGTLRDDFKRWRYRLMGKEDPFLKIGEENDRRKVSESDYVWALRDINFEVEQGDVVGIIGRNGAGKSTLLKILSRTTAPTTGSVKVKGRIASLLEVGTGFHGELSGRENIYLNGAIMGLRKWEIDKKLDEIIDFAGVERYIDTPVKRYSSGMYVRLAFAVAAHLEPDILIVDEVLAVGDAEFQEKCLGKMKDVSQGQGRTVLFVSHNLGAVKSLCGRAISLKDGLLNFSGDVNETINSYLISKNKGINKYDLENIIHRSGSRKALFSSFHIENEKGDQISKLLTGQDIILIFRLRVIDNSIKNIDIGFSFHNIYDEILSYLYSSFQKISIKPGNSEYVTVKCKIERFPFSEGKVYVKGRLLTDGIEADWPKENIGEIDIEYGDYYRTGTIVNNIAPYLLNGIWQ